MTMRIWLVFFCACWPCTALAQIVPETTNSPVSGETESPTGQPSDPRFTGQDGSLSAGQDGSLLSTEGASDEPDPVEQDLFEGDLTPDEIIRRALDTSILGFQQGEVQLDLIIRDSNGDSRQRRLNIRSMHEGDSYRALVRLVAPAEVAGQSFLFRENEDADDDIWVYLPALDDEPRRIAGRQVDESFLGTNLSYADLQGRDIREGRYTKHEDEEIGGTPVYVIDASRDDSHYQYLRLWIRRDDFIPLRIRFFSCGGDIEKTLFTEQVDRHQGRLYASRVIIADRDENVTALVVRAVDFDVDVSPLEFTRENLTR